MSRRPWPSRLRRLSRRPPGYSRSATCSSCPRGPSGARGSDGTPCCAGRPCSCISSWALPSWASCRERRIYRSSSSWSPLIGNDTSLRMGMGFVAGHPHPLAVMIQAAPGAEPDLLLAVKPLHLRAALALHLFLQGYLIPILELHHAQAAGDPQGDLLLDKDHRLVGDVVNVVYMDTTLVILIAGSG